MKGIIKSRRHGLSRHPLYTTWANMVHSCYDEKHLGYKYNGALGIKVCERWLLVENFIEDVGFKVKGKKFNRKDRIKDYGPDNWQWVKTLSEEDIVSIRKLRLDNKYSLTKTASMYDCSVSMVSKIVNRKIHNHI